MSNLPESEENGLHKLIHVLTKPEKAYLKKYSKIFISKGNTKYKTYYLILDKMKTYSKDSLRLQLEKHGGHRSFKNVEKKLYNQILEDMVIHRLDKKPDWNYYMEHLKIRFLNDCDLRDEFKKYFSVLKKAADNTNSTSIDYLYSLTHYQGLRQNFVSTPEHLKEMEKAESKIKELVQSINIGFLVSSADNRFQLIRLSNNSNKPKKEALKDMKRYEEEYLDIIPSDISTLNLDLKAKYHFLFCFFYDRTQNYDKMAGATERFYNDFCLKIVPGYSYNYGLASLLRASYFISTKNPKANDIIADFKFNLDNNLPDMQESLYSMYSQIELFAAIRFNDKDRILRFFDENEKRASKSAKLRTDKANLSYEIICAFALFRLKRYKEIQVILNKFLKAYGAMKKVYNFFFIAARFLDILIHFELKNYENLKYYITNLENEMKRNSLLIPFDKELFKHLRNLNNQLYSGRTLNKELLFDFIEHRMDLDRLETYLIYIDLKVWLEEL